MLLPNEAKSGILMLVMGPGDRLGGTIAQSRFLGKWEQAFWHEVLWQ